MENQKSLTHLLAIQSLYVIKIVIALIYWDTLHRAFICSSYEEAVKYYELAESYLPFFALVSLVIWVDILKGMNLEKLKKYPYWYKVEIFILLMLNILVVLSIGYEKVMQALSGLICTYTLAGVSLITLYPKMKILKRNHNKEVK